MARELVTPSLFIGPYVNEDELPNGAKAAAEFLAAAAEAAKANAHGPC